MRTNGRDFSGVVVPLDGTDVAGLLNALAPSAVRSDDTRVRLRAGDVRAEDGGVGKGDGARSCGVSGARLPYSSGISAPSVSRLLRLSAVILLRPSAPSVMLLSVVRRRGTRTLSCFDRRAMLMLEFERVNPARVVLGAWKSSSSWLNAYDRAVRHDCEMTSHQ